MKKNNQTRHPALIITLLILGSKTLLLALPVPLGEITIGLESFDGYQEGIAGISTDEQGRTLQIIIPYKGFGLDTVRWTLNTQDLRTLRNATATAAWWRSRLLERTITQTLIQDIEQIQPSLHYHYRSRNYPFDAIEHTLQFVRQGSDYSLLLTDSSDGASTRNLDKKSLPVFTIHLLGNQLPTLRDIISTERMAITLQDYAIEKATIQSILNSSPNS